MVCVSGIGRKYPLPEVIQAFIDKIVLYDTNENTDASQNSMNTSMVTSDVQKLIGLRSPHILFLLLFNSNYLVQI